MIKIKQIKTRLLGDPAKCIIAFRVKVVLLNVFIISVIYLILFVLKSILSI